MKVNDFIRLLDKDDRVVIVGETEDILFGSFTYTILDARKKDILTADYQNLGSREVEHIDYTKWGQVCNITLEDNKNDE